MPRLEQHSHIGYGAPHKEDCPSAHGEPLGSEEVLLTKEFFGFSPDETFVVPPGVREHFAATMGARGSRGRNLHFGIREQNTQNG